MKRLYNENAIDIFSVNDGFIVEYKKNIDTFSGKFSLGYDLVSFRDATVKTIDYTTYLNYKFGIYHDNILNVIDSPSSCSVITIPKNRILVFTSQSLCVIFDSEGNFLEKKLFMYNGELPISIAYSEGFLWAVYAGECCVAKYRIDDYKLDLIIGGKNSLFFEPEGIYSYKKSLYLCNSIDGKIFRINTKDDTVEVLKEVSIGLHKMICYNSKNIILTDEGVFII